VFLPMEAPSRGRTDDERTRAIDSAFWYHTLELPPDKTTRGYYDLRGIAHKVLPGDLSGLRCLDAATASGFWAFEMEKRGAKEVVAIDIRSFEEQDWQYPWEAPDREESARGSFELAHEALQSQVVRRDLSLYDVSPEAIGGFDFVLIGTVLLHLRDPVRALRALSGVTEGELRSVDVILLGASVLHPRQGRGLLSMSANPQWWTPNAAAHQQWLRAGGFEILESRRYLFQRYGKLFPRFPRELRRPSPRNFLWLALRQLGVPSQLIRARRRRPS
jgi:tRNA (mo5U34)-methyltransferase